MRPQPAAGTAAPDPELTSLPRFEALAGRALSYGTFDRVVSSEITLPDGTKQPSVFSANPKGILILDAGRRYADIEMRPDRPKFKASGNFRVNTPVAEWGETALAFAANFGTWSVNEADKTLIRRFEGPKQ